MTTSIENSLKTAQERNEVYGNPDLPKLIQALRRTMQAHLTDKTISDIAKILLTEEGR